MTDLPPVVAAYLDARDARDHAAALAAFAPDARVVDDGGTYDGTAEIGRWVERSSTQFTYTTTRLGHTVDDDGRVVVQVRIDGACPGGTAARPQRFARAHGLIAHLEIAP